MDERSSEFRDTLMELIETSPDPMDHPSPDQWVAYHRGELSADEEARLQEHLARCRDCFDLAAGAAAFAQPDAATGEDADSAALWRLLRPQLGSPPDNVRQFTAGPRRPSWRFRLPTYLAASFFVALVGMTAWRFQQQQRIDALRAPQPNAAVILDIAAGERATGQRELTAPAGPGTLVLVPDGDLPVYRLVIRNSATGKALPSNELRLNQDHALTLYLPEGLPPGRYRLELADRTGKVVETRLLRVTEAGRGD